MLRLTQLSAECAHTCSDIVCVCLCVCVLQGKFKTRLKAQRMINDVPVCQVDPNEKEGMTRIKPTTFNAAVNIKASVLCPTCECEKVDTQINTEAHKKLR